MFFIRTSRTLVVALAALVACQAVSIAASGPVSSTDDAGGIDARLLSHMKWRNIGPSRGGRSVAVAGVPGDPLTYYFGGTGGGVFKTTDGGNSWHPITDGQLHTGSVGAIAVAPSDPNVLYVGMGEACVRGNFSHGDGVYKSTDAGNTWKHIGLGDTRQIGKIRVHPTNPNLVYVAALGHVFGPNEQRGVFRSKDGGATWEKVLYVDDKTGAVDLSLDPTNPRIIYAGFWQVSRTPYGLNSGGPGSGLYKSADGGDTWEELTKGLPEGIKGRIGVSASGAKAGRVWAIVEAEKGGIFRSDDWGKSWKLTTDDRMWRQRAWYYTHIFADPQDPDTVWCLNVLIGKSIDGGKTFSYVMVPHGDTHDLWIAPDDNLRMINANDGGACVSYNGGESWTREDNQPTAQFYHVTTDNRFPYRVYGAQQDNSTVMIASNESPRPGAEFHSIGGGESGYIAPHPDNPNIVYAGSYDGLMTRYDHSTRTTRNITVWPENPMGWGAGELKYRFQWTFPILISPHDHNTLYAAGNVLFKSTNEGQSWEPISPDLTTNDKSKQGPSGGPITHDNTSVEYYCTIFAVAESPHEAGVIWTGSDDGLIHITKDGGKHWKNITPLDAPKWSQVSIIDPSPHDPATAYVAVNAYKSDDFTPYIFKTDNYGETWTTITEGIADDAFVRVVREDPKRKGLLYAGTETGVYVSLDDGAHWQSFQQNLPVVPITDMVIKNDDLVAATQGRSFWILDDLTSLHQLTDGALQKPVHLFDPRNVHAAIDRSVSILYHLREDAEDVVKLEFLDAVGEVIKAFASDDDEKEDDSPFRRLFGGAPKQEVSTDAGSHKFDWNMRHSDATKVPGAIMWGGSTSGPRIGPGTYTVKLTVGEESFTQRFDVQKDPRLDTSDEHLAKKSALLLRIRDRVSDAHDAINRIRAIKRQAKAAGERVKDYSGNEEVAKKAKELAEKLEAIENELLQTKSKSMQDPLNFPIKLNDKLAALSGVVGRGEFPPTDQVEEVFDHLSKQLDEQLKKLAEVEITDVPAFNKLVANQKIPAIIKKKDEKEK